jgi:hypothetical protein
VPGRFELGEHFRVHDSIGVAVKLGLLQLRDIHGAKEAASW